MLQRMFPDAQFVHLIRDGRDAVSSLTRMPWFDGDIHAAALTWREAVDTGRHLRERLGQAPSTSSATRTSSRSPRRRW